MLWVSKLNEGIYTFTMTVRFLVAKIQVQQCIKNIHIQWFKLYISDKNANTFSFQNFLFHKCGKLVSGLMLLHVIMKMVHLTMHIKIQGFSKIKTKILLARVEYL